MSFIQTEIDRTVFRQPADRRRRDLWQGWSLDSIQPATDQPATPSLAAKLVDGFVASGLPALIIPLFLGLGAATPQTWLFAAFALPLIARSVGAATPQRVRVSAWLSLLGHAGLTTALILAAADHVAFSIATIAGTSATGLTMYLALPLAVLLASGSWVMARRDITLARRDMLVIESITIALTLIVLANYSSLGSTLIDIFGSATPLNLIADSVGLATLSPVLSAGIAFCFFIAGLSSFKSILRAMDEVSPGTN